MLVRVEATNAQGALLALPLDDDSSGIFVQEIAGLDPVKATLVSTSFAGADGAQYHSAHREARNITAKMGVEPDYLNVTVSDLRKRLYAFFMPKSLVHLAFIHDDGLRLTIDGRVESFDFPLFAQDPEADLSLMCFDPDFIDPIIVSKLNQMSVSTAVETTVPYLGTVDVGGVFTFRPDRAVNAFTVYLRTADGQQQIMDFTVPLLAGDKLEISTVTGSKYATLTRGGTTSSVLYGVTPQSAWLNFKNGDNKLRVYATGAPFPFDYNYITRYGGL